jgi:sarcosine oxidase subunit beta
MTDDSDAFDAIVIGAGVIGGAIAHELSGRGWRTLTVDKGASAGTGSTSNSCAIVRFSYSSVAGINLAWEGMHYWRDWPNYIGTDDELGLIDYHMTGQVVFQPPGEGTHSARVKMLWDQLDIPHEVWNADELRARYPYLDLGIYGPPTRPDDEAFWAEPDGQIEMAYFAPDAGYVSDPQLSCHNLQRGAEARGATFWFHSEVASIDQTGQKVTGVTLTDGRAPRAPVVINVAGPHSYLINQMAGVYDTMNIKTRALRHEVHHVPAPQGADFSEGAPTGADDDLGIYFRPEVGNNLLIGSGDPSCDEREYVDPDNYDTQIGEEQWRVQVLRANRRIPTLGVPHERRGIVDLYDVSDDWLPIYDRTDLDGFYVAIGTSGNQYKNAGSAGQMMADLIEAVQAGHDHDADPLTTTGRYTGRPLNIGFFSRNRAIDPNSSMTVHG